MHNKRQPAKVMLAVRVPEQLRRELRKIAAREDRKLGDQVTRAPREHLERHRERKGGRP